MFNLFNLKRFTEGHQYLLGQWSAFALCTAKIQTFPTTFLLHVHLTVNSAACKHGRFMSEREYVSKTWHSLCTPWSERLHFLISKLDTLDSWHLTPHFTCVAEWHCSPFSSSCGVAEVTVDTAVLCYAELWEPPHSSPAPPLRKSVSHQMDSKAAHVSVYVWTSSSSSSSNNDNNSSNGTSSCSSNSGIITIIIIVVKLLLFMWHCVSLKYIELGLS